MKMRAPHPTLPTTKNAKDPRDAYLLDRWPTDMSIPSSVQLVNRHQISIQHQR